MKKSKFFTLLLVLTMAGSTAFAGSNVLKSDAEVMTVPVTESKLMEQEITNMTERLEEIRDMDKSDMTAKDKKELKKELKDIKKAGGSIYIGGASLILLIILILVLL